MKTLSKLPALLILSTALAAGAARAGVVEINIGGANLYSLGNFNPTGAEVQGSLLVGKDMNAASYTVNKNNKDAFGSSGYALVVGGNLSYNSGSIQNGSYYAGGTTNITSNTGLDTATKSSTSPVSF
ncbi:collagen-binding domain-containing protein [Janthinobacterium sp. PSPC3-1]